VQSSFVAPRAEISENDEDEVLIN